MITPKVDRAVIGWRFWLWWMVASVVGSGAGVLLWLASGIVLEAAGVNIDSPRTVFGALFPGVVGAAFGTPFGIAQWLVLRRQVGRAGWWVLATSLGYVVVFLLGTSLFPRGNALELGFAEQVLLGTVLGAMVSVPGGILQWLMVLRRQVAQAGWWVLASVVSWAVGFAISFALRVTLGGLFFVAGVVVALALTGLAMVWLLRRPAPSEAKRATAV